MKTKGKAAWKLPIMFLIGYMVAWGSILIDRQMLISEQKALSEQLALTKKQLRVKKMMEDFGSDWQEMVIWNKEKKQDPPKEVEVGQVDK